MADETLHFYPYEARVMPLTLIQRERRLPAGAPGEVLVHLNERVEPTQVVARAHHTHDFRILDVANALRVPRSQVKRHMLKEMGAAVEAGQPLAVRGVLGAGAAAGIRTIDVARA